MSNALQDLVIQRLYDLGSEGKPMSARTAAARSRGLVSNDTLSRIARGTHTGSITDRTLQGIAHALDVPLTDVYAAAKIPRPQSRWTMPTRLDRLDPAQRQIVEDVAGALLEAYEKGWRDASAT